MSSLTDNLQTIYGIKNQIKEVIGTQSDLFSDYPAYIAAAIEAGGEIPAGYTYVSGTYNITTNGTGIDIASYASVDVAVPIPAGYIVPAGTKSIASNGSNIDVTAYAAVDVAVPIPAGYIVPAGTKSITSNGSNIDVTAYAAVDVAVPIPSGYVLPAGTITIDDNEIGNNVDVSSYQYAYIDIQGGGGGTVEPTNSYAFFMLMDDTAPTGSSLPLYYTDYYDEYNGTIWQSVDIYSGVHRTEEYMDPTTAQVTYCNSYYSVEIRNSNNQLVNTFTTACYDCGNPFAIDMYGNISGNTSLYFHLYWNHGEATADENDPEMMIANWTTEDLGVIGFDGLAVSHGTNHIVITALQTTEPGSEGDISEAKLWNYIDNKYQLVDEWQAPSE